MRYSHWKRRESSSELTIPMPGAELYVTLCKVRRFCGKQARKAQAGAQRDAENSTARGRTDRCGSTSMLVTSDLALMAFCLWGPSAAYLHHPRRVRAKISLCFFPPPGYFQRDFPQFAFDINTIHGVAVSARTAVGLHGKSNLHTEREGEREREREREEGRESLCVCACARVCVRALVLAICWLPKYLEQSDDICWEDILADPHKT